MNSDDQKLDRLIKGLLNEVGIEKVPSDDFTHNVLMQAAQIQSIHHNKLSSWHKILLFISALAVYLVWAALFFILWKNGLIEALFSRVPDLFSFTTEYISFKGMVTGLVIFVIHFFIIRFVILAYFIKNGQLLFSKPKY